MKDGKIDAVTKLLKLHYGLDGTISKLNSYIDLNFLVDTGTSKYVLKLNTPETSSEDFLLAQNEVLKHLNRNDIDLAVPRLHPLLRGAGMIKIDLNNSPYYMRLFSFLTGEFFHETNAQDLFENLGQSVARLDNALMELKFSAIESRHLRWDLQYALDCYDYLPEIQDTHNRRVVEYFFLQFELEVLPQLKKFRKSIIHADANEANILVDHGKISGLIDFGDMVYSQTINELAIAVTYAILTTSDPMAVAKKVIKGYHEVLPLTFQEIDALYYLIAVRLCISVCMSAHAKELDPTNEYISISEKPAWAMLHQWLAINPAAASNAFREACGIIQQSTPDLSDALIKRKNSFSDTLSLSYEEPIYMERAAFQYMYDANGKTYLDAYNNIPHVGHSHPRVVKAGMYQMAHLNTNTRYVYDQLQDYAGRLLKKFPESLTKVFFVNSGSAATDLAIRLARAHTGQKDMIVMEHGYHGHTQAGIEISAYKFLGKGGLGKSEHIHVAPIPDTYKGKFRGDSTQVAEQYVHEVEKLISGIQKNDRQLCAFIAEPIVGCGGQVMLPQNYLKKVYGLIREQNGLCISDEVQTGFGRMGSCFWGFELYDVVPDIVILGKPMGNGHPMGAVVVSDAVAKSFQNGMEFFSSFGGNPVSCAIGKAVLDVIEEENLQHNALRVGNYLMEGFNTLGRKFPIIGHVRGSGLFIGVELVRDNNTLEPATEEAKKIINKMKDAGILLSTDGPFNNVIKMKPPMCLTERDADQVLSALEKVLKQM